MAKNIRKVETYQTERAKGIRGFFGGRNKVNHTVKKTTSKVSKPRGKNAEMQMIANADPKDRAAMYKAYRKGKTIENVSGQLNATANTMAAIGSNAAARAKNNSINNTSNISSLIGGGVTDTGNSRDDDEGGNQGVI